MPPPPCAALGTAEVTPALATPLGWAVFRAHDLKKGILQTLHPSLQTLPKVQINPKTHPGTPHTARGGCRRGWQSTM